MKPPGKRNAEERLRQSEEMFRLLVESVKDYAIFVLDPGGHVLTWNDGAQRIKQYKFEEIRGKHFSTFYPEEDIRAQKPERELATAIQEGRVEDEGWRIARTAPDSGPTWSSPRCSTRRASCAASPR